MLKSYAQRLAALEEALIALCGEGEPRTRLLRFWLVFLTATSARQIPPSLRQIFVDIKSHFCDEQRGAINQYSEAALTELRGKIVTLYREWSAYMALARWQANAEEKREQLE